jgi:hypothetical protein
VKKNSGGTSPECVRLDQIVIGKLPERVINSIDKIELTLGEMNEWASHKPSIMIEVAGKRVFLDIHLCISKSKLLALLAATIGTLTGFIGTIVLNIDKIYYIVQIIRS